MYAGLNCTRVASSQLSPTLYRIRNKKGESLEDFDHMLDMFPHLLLPSCEFGISWIWTTTAHASCHYALTQGLGVAPALAGPTPTNFVRSLLLTGSNSH